MIRRLGGGQPAGQRGGHRPGRGRRQTCEMLPQGKLSGTGITSDTFACLAATTYRPGRRRTCGMSPQGKLNGTGITSATFACSAACTVNQTDRHTPPPCRLSALSTPCRWGSRSRSLATAPGAREGLRGTRRSRVIALRTQLVQSRNRISDEFLKVSANPAQGKGGSCFGDSGGPNLLGDTILGVNSFLTSSNCAGVTYSYRIDTTEALSFINATIAAHT